MKKLLFLFLLLLIPFSVKSLEISAGSYAIMDIDSKTLILGKNIHNERSVASISKIMTAIVAIENGKLNKKITIGDEILAAYGSGIYIKEGEVLTLKDLLYGLMLRSGNDAALAIAKNVGGTVDKFVEMMNKKAKEIGMENSTFNNPSGLDEENGNISTVYDMALLTSYAMENKDYREIVKTKKYILKTNKNTYSWTNKNKLLSSYKYTTGGKTGYTEIAKRTLVTTASKEDINLVVVTLNDGNDWQDHKELFEYVFNNYKKYLILKKGKIIIEDDYYSSYEHYIKNDYSYLLDNSEKDNIVIKYVIDKKRKIKNNMEIGEAQIYLGDKLLHSEKIYIKKEIKITFWDKIKSWFKLW